MQLITYLTFGGNCEEVINFYKEAIGAEVLFFTRMGDGQMETPEHLKSKVMHARLKIGENTLYMSDTFDPSAVNYGNNISLSLQMDNAGKLETVFNKLSEGGTVKMPLQKTFWAEKFGMFTDKFGIHWMMNFELSETTSADRKEASLN